MLNEMFRKYNLVQLQNNQANVNHDYLSFAGFFDTEKEFSDLAKRLQYNIETHTGIRL